MDEGNPYQSPTAALELPAMEHEQELAGRGLRLGCAILDSVLGGIVMMPLMLAAMFSSGILSGDGPPSWLIEAIGSPIGNLLFQLAFALVGFVLFLVLQGYPLARYGQTWAKRWFGIRIVDLQGRKPDFGRMVMLRYGAVQLAGLVPCLGALFVLADVLFIFGDDRRCIHDLMAGTRVVVGSPE
jgi:uncharacterized RDD family membrane protein YckC